MTLTLKYLTQDELRIRRVTEKQVEWGMQKIKDYGIPFISPFNSSIRFWRFLVKID